MPRGRKALPYVLLAYAFRALAKRRRHLGLTAIQELAPWLAKFVRKRTIRGEDLAAAWRERDEILSRF